MSARLLRPEGLDRRSWLKVGGLSVGALATLPNLNLTRLLASSGADRDFSVILFWANGGPSHLETFDLKPGAPAEIRGPSRPTQTNVPGIQFTDRLPRLAKLADKLAIVRSLYHNRGEHSGGTHRFLTGYASVAANLQNAEYPDAGSIIAKVLEAKAGEVPLYIGNTKFYGGGPGYLGPAYAPFMPNPNPVTSTGNNTYDPVPLYLQKQTAGTLTLDDDGALIVRRRDNLRQALEAVPRSLERDGPESDFGRQHRRAVELLAGPRTREAFDYRRENSKTLERYGDTDWGRDLLTARRLVEAGARFVQCQANLRVKESTGRTTTWDDHSVNVDIFKAYEERMPLFDQAVSALVEDLYDRGLDRHVLFIFAGEFGRTPRIGYQDASKRPGRDHWPRAMSVLLSGGGLKMGQVIGSTNTRGEEPASRGMDSNCLLATIYRRFGIDLEHMIRDRTGRPIAILPTGEPIAELL